MKPDRQNGLYWNWPLSGLALAACFLLAVVLAKPIGVSTQFVILDGLVANNTLSSELVTADATTESGYRSSNPYLNKSGGKTALVGVGDNLVVALILAAAMLITAVLLEQRYR